MNKAASFLGLLFRPEDGGDMFPRNVVWLSQDYMVFIPEDGTLHNHYCENSCGLLVYI
jgi:hypothetical protein